MKQKLPSHIKRAADWTTYDDVVMSINFLVAILVIGIIMYDFYVTFILKGHA